MATKIKEIIMAIRKIIEINLIKLALLYSIIAIWRSGYSNGRGKNNCLFNNNWDLFRKVSNSVNLTCRI